MVVNVQKYAHYILKTYIVTWKFATETCYSF